MKWGLEVGAWDAKGLIVAARGWSFLPGYWLVLSNYKRILTVCLGHWAQVHAHRDVEGRKDVHWVSVFHVEVRAMSDLSTLLLFSSQLLRRILLRDIVSWYFRRLVRGGRNKHLRVCLQNFVWGEDWTFWVVHHLLELNRGVFQKPVSWKLLVPELVWTDTELAFWLENV